MLHHQIDNLVLVVLFCEHSRCCSSLVLVLDVDSLFQQKFNHLVAALLDCVVDWGLAISVHNVEQ